MELSLLSHLSQYLHLQPYHTQEMLTEQHLLLNTDPGYGAPPSRPSR